MEYDSEVWEKFGDKVGWRKKNEWLYYKDLTFSEQAPEAHLPAWGGGSAKGWVWCGVFGAGSLSWSWYSLASRLVDCNI